MKNLTELATAAIAISTVIGVGFGIASFFTQFTKLLLREIFLIVIIYIIAILISIRWLKEKVE